MSTPIEMVREHIDARVAQPGTEADLDLDCALASVLRDAERFAALERAHESAQTHQGWSTMIKEKWKTHPRRVLCAGTLAELADRLREEDK